MVSEKKERIQTLINKIKFCLTRFETVDNISELDYMFQGLLPQHGDYI